MGIEFSPKAGSTPGKKIIFQETSLRSKETPPAISLEEAMKREPQLVRKTQKKKVDLEELRHLLEDSLAKPKEEPATGDKDSQADEDWVDEEKALEKRNY